MQARANVHTHANVARFLTIVPQLGESVKDNSGESSARFVTNPRSLFRLLVKCKISGKHSRFEILLLCIQITHILVVISLKDLLPILVKAVLYILFEKDGYLCTTSINMK